MSHIKLPREVGVIVLAPEAAERLVAECRDAPYLDLSIDGLQPENWCREMKGLQIGLLNGIKEGGPKWLPVVNCRF